MNAFVVAALCTLSCVMGAPKPKPYMGSMGSPMRAAMAPPMGPPMGPMYGYHDYDAPDHKVMQRDAYGRMVSYDVSVDTNLVHTPQGFKQVQSYEMSDPSVPDNYYMMGGARGYGGYRSRGMGAGLRQPAPASAPVAASYTSNTVPGSVPKSAYPAPAASSYQAPAARSAYPMAPATRSAYPARSAYPMAPAARSAYAAPMTSYQSFRSPYETPSYSNNYGAGYGGYGGYGYID